MTWCVDMEHLPLKYRLERVEERGGEGGRVIRGIACDIIQCESLAQTAAKIKWGIALIYFATKI